jgi:hypothetical protein
MTATKKAAKQPTTSTGKSRQLPVKAERVDRPFPRRTIAEAAKVAEALKINGGNPWSPDDVAKALGYTSKASNAFFYLASASREFGLTTGGRDSKEIGLADRGRRYAYAPGEAAERDTLREAFFSVTVFKGVFDHYQGPALPEKKYASNVLESNFGLDPSTHDEFIELFKKNCQTLGLTSTDRQPLALGPAVGRPSRPEIVTVDEPNEATDEGHHLFVIMPFREHLPEFRQGFFAEVLKSIIGPAGKKAGFHVSTANIDGSDVIQSTIVNRLLDDDLVICDLTEHNPNVLFELGMRMAFDRPVVLIKAKGTKPIFDVDNMLRVFEYDPNLWPSTVEQDVPGLAQFIKATWNNRASENTYLRLLSRMPSDAIPRKAAASD